MKRAVYIGGFGNGKSSAEHVASALEPYYDNIDIFTFSEAMESPGEVSRAVKGVDTITHSAGLLAVKNTAPRSIEAFGAPLPTNRISLVGRTGLKIARMHLPGTGIRSSQDIWAVGRYDLGTAAELARHPKRNLGRLGAIAHFNAVEAAAAARKKNILPALHYHDGDEYFQLSLVQETQARAAGVEVIRLPGGIHDELVIRPQETLQSVKFGERRK